MKYSKVIMIKFKPPTKIEIKESTRGGYGCFVTEPIKKGEVIEICKVIPARVKNYSWLDLRIFKPVLALGYGSLYNHSDTPNVSRDNFMDELFIFKSLTDIGVGEELLVNYGDSYWKNKKGKII